MRRRVPRHIRIKPYWQDASEPQSRTVPSVVEMLEPFRGRVSDPACVVSQCAHGLVEKSREVEGPVRGGPHISGGVETGDCRSDQSTGSGIKGSVGDAEPAGDVGDE